MDNGGKTSQNHTCATRQPHVSETTVQTSFVGVLRHPITEPPQAYRKRQHECTLEGGVGGCGLGVYISPAPFVQEVQKPWLDDSLIVIEKYDNPSRVDALSGYNVHCLQHIQC